MDSVQKEIEEIMADRAHSVLELDEYLKLENEFFDIFLRIEKSSDQKQKDLLFELESVHNMLIGLSLEKAYLLGFKDKNAVNTCL